MSDAEHTPTLAGVRDAIARLHWTALEEKRRETAWIEALRAAAHTVKKLRSKAA